MMRGTRALPLAAALLTGLAAGAQEPPAPPALPFPQAWQAGAAPAPAGIIPGTPPDPSADLAYGAYQRGHYLEAFREATKRIEANPDDSAAMTLLGEIIAGGLGVPIDQAKAVSWYRIASQRGDRNATFALAMMTLRGEGTDKDEAKGLALLEDAAKAGHPAAAYNLGLAAVTKGDDTRAAMLFRQAAEAGEAAAQHALASLLRTGRGGPRDAFEAAAWMKRSAEAFYEPAEIEYAIMLFNGEGTTKDPARAAGLFLRAASRGNPIAQNRLARLRVVGIGVIRDLNDAAAWHALAKAAGRDDPWLDSALAGLTDEERRKATELATERLRAFQMGLTSP
jgi:TPR repeat protein